MSAVELELRRASHYIELHLMFGHHGLLQKARESMQRVNQMERADMAQTVRPKARVAA